MTLALSDTERLARALEAVLPAASYGASVATQTRKAGYSAMARSLKAARAVLAELRPGALVCRQADHPYAPAWDGKCARCRMDMPPEGPFVWQVDDVANDVSRCGATATEKGAKAACSRAMDALTPGVGLRIRPGLFASIVAPDGRRWEVNTEWRGGCSSWQEAPTIVPGEVAA